MNANEIVVELEILHRESILLWKENAALPTQVGFLKLVEDNHAFNYQLWHEEDKARRDDKGFEFVYHAKRNIDGFNQQRNNCMELMDKFLYQSLKPVDSTTGICPVHSETPGMMIDRLSILSLKQYHMTQQTLRSDVGDDHRHTCLHKLALMNHQKNQLLNCLQIFLQEIADKTRTFTLYHQLKMYNDKTLNPELYNNALATK